MSTLVGTSNNQYATGWTNGRKIDRCSNGVLWSFIQPQENSINVVYCYYSTNGGSTWTQATGSQLTNYTGSVTQSYQRASSFFIDADDNCHAVFKDMSDGRLYYKRGTPNAGRTTWLWSSGLLLYTNTATNYPDIVAFRDPADNGGWKAHIVSAYADASGNAVSYFRVNITSGATISLDTSVGLDPGGIGYGVPNVYTFPSIDFQHTGDGKTPVASPALFAAWSAGSAGPGRGIRYRKASYSVGSWTWGADQTINDTVYIPNNNNNIWVQSIFDGSDSYVIYTGLGSGNYYMQIMKRDAADTTTTTVYDSHAFSGTAGTFGGGASYDGSNIYFVGTSYDDSRLNLYKFNLSGATVAVTMLDLKRATYGNFSVRRGSTGGTVDWIYCDSATSPYSIRFNRTTTAAITTMTIVGKSRTPLSNSAYATYSSIVLPAGIQANDLIVIQGTEYNSSTMGAPAGYLTIYTGQFGSGGTYNVVGHAWYKVAVGNESNTTVNLSVGNGNSISCVVLRGPWTSIGAGTVASGGVGVTTNVPAHGPLPVANTFNLQFGHMMGNSANTNTPTVYATPTDKQDGWNANYIADAIWYNNLNTGSQFYGPAGSNNSASVLVGSWSITTAVPTITKDISARWNITNPASKGISWLWNVAAPSILVTAELWENGVFKSALGYQAITPGTTKAMEFKWDASLLTDTTGNGVEIRFYSNAAVNINAAGWDAQMIPLIPINLAKSLLWNTVGRVLIGTIELWNVNNVASKSSQELWNMRAVVNKSEQNLWNVFARVNQPRVLLWNDRLIVVKADSFIWNDRLAVTKLDQFLWGDSLAVSKSRQELWNVALQIAKTGSELWNVRNSVGSDNSFMWDYLNSLSMTGQELWDNLAIVPPRIDQILWNDNTVTSKDSSEIWRTMQTVFRDGQEIWNLRASLTQSAQILWALVGWGSKTADFRWNTTGQTSKDISELWNVRASVGTSRQQLWNVLRSASVSKQEIWRVLSLTGVSKAMLWNLDAVISKAATELWNVRIGTTTDVDIEWADLIGSTTDTDFQWNQEQTIFALEQILWNIIALRIVNAWTGVWTQGVWRIWDGNSWPGQTPKVWTGTSWQ